MIIYPIDALYKLMQKFKKLFNTTPEKNGFLMIGDKDSGKTTYMNCAYGMLKSTNIGGVSIVAKYETDDLLFSKLFSNVKSGIYPLPTEKRNQYEFNITYNGETIHEFSWTDYNGGILFQQSNQDAVQFTKDIKNTSGLMLFFDSQRLARHDMDEVMRRMIKIISQSLPSVENEFFINIILTKFDMLKKKEQKNLDLLTQDLRPLTNIIDGNDNIHLNIIPVCCKKDKIINCDDSLMLMMIGPLKVYKKLQKNRIMNLFAEMSRWEAEAGPFNSIIAYFKGEKSAAQKARECKMRAEEMQSQLDGLVRKIDSIQDDLQKRNYLDKIICS